VAPWIPRKQAGKRNWQILGEGFLGGSSESLQILVCHQVFNFFLTRIGELEVRIVSLIVWNITCPAKMVCLIAGKKVTAVLVVTFSITVYMEEVRLENDFNLFPFLIKYPMNTADYFEIGKAFENLP
jgi:hypothetical protein